MIGARMLFVKSAILVLPFALILAFIEYELRQTPNSYSVTRAALESRLDTVEVLVTGSSHAQAGVRAELLDGEAFNLAYGSQSLHYDTGLVLKYAPAMPRLRLVIFTISYHSLEYRLSNSIERWRAGFYQQVYGLPNEDARLRLRLTNYSYIAIYTPREAYRRAFARLLGNNAASDAPGDQAGIATDASGNEAGVATNAPGERTPIRQSAELTEDSGHKRVRLHESEMYERDIPANRAALERVCEELLRRKVAVVFITIPVHQTYYRQIQPAAYRRMQDTVRQMSNKYRIEYFNYMFDSRFGDQDFLNSDHLNGKGAEKFTMIMNQDVMKKYLSDRARF